MDLFYSTLRNKETTVKKQETSYWPHMILGFLLIGVTLGYWTVKSASHMPVSEENSFMMPYQQAELGYNTILDEVKAFDKRYDVSLEHARYVRVPVKNSKAKKSENAVVLHPGKNSFIYRITDKAGNAASDLNVSFLLTRPNTTADDVMIKQVAYRDGTYPIEGLTITKPGRYILRLRAQKGKAVKYLDIPAYLAPQN